MRTEFVSAGAVGVFGLVLMAMNIPICSNICFVDNFFELFLPKEWERKAGGLPLICVALGLAAHAARNRY